MAAEMHPLPQDVGGIKLSVVQDQQSRGWRHMPIVEKLEHLDNVQATHHIVLDNDTPDFQMERELLNDILPIKVKRSTVDPIWGGTDLSEAAGTILGLQELMCLLYENPDLIQRLMRFMRDAVLVNLDQGEAAGDRSTADNQNYDIPPHAHDLPESKANSYGASLKDL
jgi:hypothetical protein